MKPHYFTIFLLLLSFSTSSFFAQPNPNHKRILHQPFFPSLSSPPPPPPPPPPPQHIPDLPDPDEPFFHELPAGPPPPRPQGSDGAAANLVITQKSSSNKKLAIGITSGILVLAILSALAFYIHNHKKSKIPNESPRHFNQESQIPPSNFLYIGTVEPSATSIVNNANALANMSPYRKLNSGKRSNYRPSPDLQPLPPLSKPPPPPVNDSPPPMSSSDDDDDESQETSFYTPNGSHSSKLSYNSKRTKPVIIPSIKQSMPYFCTPKIAEVSVPTPPPPPPPRPPVLPVQLPKFGPGVRPNPFSFNKETSRIDEENSLERNGSEEKDGSKPRLKPLHWDKVRATSERATAWDQIKSSSFQLNEDAMETLFGCNSTNSVPKEGLKKSALPSFDQEIRVLDPKKSQNIAILLRALNVTRDEITEALLDGNLEGLGLELLETLVKMAPTKEEEIKLKDYNGDISKLGSAERFLKAILDIPFAYKRVEAMLYRANFDTEVNYLRKSFQTLEEASQELKNSRLFLKLLEAVLRTGNRMNDGTNRGDARAFKLDTLLKLVDVKGTDGKTTLLHFVVQEIIRADGEDPNLTNGLQVVSGLSKELGNVKKAASMDSDVLSGYVSKLEMGLEKVKLVLQYEKQCVVLQDKFFGSMKEFLREASEEISVVKAEERKSLSLVKEATQYFHGDAAKEEARPFRIFMIVRDFLSILDNVCKDVGRMQDRTTMGTGRSFRVMATATLPVLNRYNIRNETSSDGDSL